MTKQTLIPNQVVDILIKANLSELEHKIMMKLILSTKGHWEWDIPVSLKTVAETTGNSIGDILIAFGKLVKYSVAELAYSPLSVRNSIEDDFDPSEIVLFTINLDWKSWNVPIYNWRGDIEMNKEVKEMAKQILNEVIDAENPNIEVFYRNGLLEIEDIAEPEDGIQFSEDLYDIEPDYMATEMVIISEELKMYFEEI